MILAGRISQIQYMNILLTSGLVFLSIVAIVLLTSKLKLNAFISLFLVSVLLALFVLNPQDIVKSIKEGFGNTMASIGFLIIFGAIIGIILDKTGATLSIAKYILSKTGEKRAAMAIGLTGFLTGLVIFCDTGFIILSGLARSISHRTKVAMPVIAGVLATSLYSVHCLVPTHPGALAASGIIGVNIGNLVLAGILFAIPGALAAFYWNRLMAREVDPKPAEPAAMQLSGESLPPVWLSVLPILVPLLLIMIGSLLAVIGVQGKNTFFTILLLAGNPVFALAIGVVCAIPLVKGSSIGKLNAIFEESISKAGPILVITAAGGMFGTIIRLTGIGEEAGRMLNHPGVGVLVPFLIAMVLKTAQGSSTVAIITAASFVAPMLPSLGLDSSWGRLLSMLAMGAGSMAVSHANDSYFWVISRFSDIDADTTLKVYSSATLVMGLVVFACVWLCSLLVL